jgi:hypothetical protein
LVKDSGKFNRVKELGQARVYPEELGLFAVQVRVLRTQLGVFELCRSGVLDSAGAVLWSLHRASSLRWRRCFAMVAVFWVVEHMVNKGG